MRRPPLPVLLAGAVLLGLLIGRGCRPTPPSPVALTSVAPTVQAPPITLQAATLPDVAEGALPAVVSIYTLSGRQGALGLFGAPPNTGLGSGVVVSTEGVVVTNAHVVNGADRIMVRLADGRAVAAELVGIDEPSDLAVVRLAEPVDELRVLPWGDSDALRLGELVIAVGNPFDLAGTVTMGIVSAKGRSAVTSVDYEDFIQTDAAINPGNSGGAMVNIRGELVGINTAILSQSGGAQGVGFAIPSNMARPILESLLATGTVERGFLGVRLAEVDPEQARELPGGARGALVSLTVARSPAERAGIQPGDIIVQVQGQPVESVSRLRNLIAIQGAGAKVALRLLRDGQLLDVQVRLDELGRRRR
jgi:serine protease Do